MVLDGDSGFLNPISVPRTSHIKKGEDFSSQPPNFYLKNLQEEYLNSKEYHNKQTINT